MLGRKNCYYCKFCVKADKQFGDGWKLSDLTKEDLSDMYGLRQESSVKCYRGQWDEETNPELKTQSLKRRSCKYFADRKKNKDKNYDQVVKEQEEKFQIQLHKESLRWAKIGFLAVILSITIGLVSQLPTIMRAILRDLDALQ